MDDNIGLERDSDTLNNLYSLLLACLANSEMDFVGSFNQIEKNISKIVSLEKIENMTNFGTISREDREYREVALIADNVKIQYQKRSKLIIYKANLNQPQEK